MFGQGTETTFVIKKSNKDEWVVRYMNEVPLAQAPPPPPERSVVVFTTVPSSTRCRNRQPDHHYNDHFCPYRWHFGWRFSE